MAGFYKTEVKPTNVAGLSNLVAQASQSPLSALSKGMSELDGILTNRDKEQYSKKVTEDLGQLTSSNDLQKYMMGIDRSRLTDATSKGIDSNLANAIALEGLTQKDKQLQLKTIETLGEQGKDADTSAYLSDLNKLFSVKDEYKDQLPLAVSSLQQAYPKADITKGTSTVNKLYEEEQKPYQTTSEKLKDRASLMANIKKVSRDTIKDGKLVNFNVDTAAKNQQMFMDLASEKEIKEVEGFAAKKLNKKKLARLEEDIQLGIKNGTFSDNPVQDIVYDTITKYTPKKWSLIPDKDRNEAIERIATQGAIGVVVADYLRQMSGTAASEKEAMRTLNNMMGGGRATSIDVRLANLKKYRNNYNEDVKNSALDLYKKGYQYDAGTYLDSLNKTAKSFNEGDTATNPKTGEKMIFTNGKWTEVK